MYVFFEMLTGGIFETFHGKSEEQILELISTKGIITVTYIATYLFGNGRL